jgi:hypothetical protein
MNKAGFATPRHTGNNNQPVMRNDKRNILQVVFCCVFYENVAVHESVAKIINEDMVKIVIYKVN